MTPEELHSASRKALFEYNAARLHAKSERRVLADSKKRLADAKTAQLVLQTVAAAVQTKAHAQVSAVVTRCIQTVFPDAGYSFRIKFERKRGKTEAKLVFVKCGTEIDPTSADSGGVTQVAAFGLRLAALLLATPRKRKLLVLDEPFSCVSAGHRPRLASLLEALSAEMGVQIILVTHDPELRVGKVIEVQS